MNMDTYAIVKDGNVINIVIWDGKSEWSVPEGCTAVATGPGAAVGGTFNGTTFTAPAVPQSPSTP